MNTHRRFVPIAISLLLCAAVGCGRDPQDDNATTNNTPTSNANTPDMGGHDDAGGGGDDAGLPDAGGGGDAGSPDAGGDDMGGDDMGGTEGMEFRLEGSLTPSGGGPTSGGDFAVTGHLVPALAPEASEGGGFRLEVRPLPARPLTP